MDANVLQKAQYWASSHDFDEQTRAEIADLIERKAYQAINDRFFRDLAFGTGGMRGIMGAGSFRMNIYNIRRATTALSTYLKQQQRTEPGIKVAISYDSRNNSRAFAHEAAMCLAAKGIKVYITKTMRAVPILSFMVRHFGCDAGICITASHNPPQYNGYKVFWKDGGQLTPPHDEAVVALYESLSYSDLSQSMNFDDAVKKDLVFEVEEELDLAYYKAVERLRFDLKNADQFNIVYTPLHGTGVFSLPPLLKRFGFSNVNMPDSQKEPDGNFPTVSFPNPEDPEALKIAINLARVQKADLVLATDPDSDRIGLVVKDGDEYTRLDGNQIICLLTDYLLFQLKEKNTLPHKGYVVSTIVTSPLVEKIAAFYGVACFKTLTGFKWIGEFIEKGARQDPEWKFICGGEESFGFLPLDHVRDKDAIISGVLAAQMCLSYKNKNVKISQVLDELYLRHGYYLEDLINITLEGEQGQKRIEEIMNTFRTNSPKQLAGLKVIHAIDYQNPQRLDSVAGPCPISFELPKSDVLEFHLDSGIRFCIRPSGTEPKVKVYLFISYPKASNLSELKNQKESAKTLRNQLQNELKRILQ